MSQFLSRRNFLKAGLMTGAGLWIGTNTGFGRKLSPNDTLNIGVIGVANRGAANLAGVREENIVALCDVDATYLAAARNKFPKARTFNDFRKMLELRDLDAVVVSTPDHTHAVAAMAALKSGRHVYCEKPLAHNVSEIRALTTTAAKTQLATQMGIQIHATDNYRRVVELIEKQVIGPVKEVHIWCDRAWGGKDRPTDTPPVPKTLSWDLWLGPAHERAYHPAYVPREWRRWWDFGGGSLGDMGCHYMDLPFWALKLHAPTSIEAKGPAVHKEATPEWQTVHYQFPARESLPAVEMIWYNNAKRPALIEDPKLAKWNAGVLFVGSKGMLLADYGKRVLLPEKDFADFQPPAPYIPESMGHHNEWIKACKGGAPASCNFSYGGPLSETVLLGNVAYRAGTKLEWDSATLKVTNTSAADEFLRREYRKGWSL